MFKRGIGFIFVVMLLAALSAVPAFAARSLNCSLDDCTGLESYWSLDSLDFNDDFSSATVNTERWNVWEDYNGDNTLSFDGQVMSISMGTSGAGWTSAGVRSWYRLRGDFDIAVDFKNLVIGSSSDGGLILHVDDTNGDNFYVRRQLVPQRVDVIAQANDGTPTVFLNGGITMTSGSLRLTRSGNTMCGYYSNTIGGAWISAGCNANNEWAQDMQPLVQFALYNPSGTNTAQFDNFRIIQGQIVTDNAGTAYNPGDTFSSTTIDPDKWLFSYGKAGQNGNELVLNMTPAGGWVANGVQSRYLLIGDFDVQVDFKDLVAGAAIDGGVAMLIVDQYADDDAIVLRRQFANSNGYQFFEHRNSGAWNQVGSNIATTDTTGKLRLTRSGNTISGYYWNGASWTLAQTYSNNEFLQPMYLRLELSGGDSPDNKQVKYDNLILNSGTTSLSNGNTGYTYGANYTTGKFGNALQFNGLTDYVDVGSFNPPNPHNVTLSAWFNMTSLGVTNGYYTNYILAKGADANANSYGLFVGSGSSAFSSSAVCVMVATGSGYQPLCAPVGQLIPGKWHYAVGVIEGQNFRVYVDGQLKSQSTFTGTISQSGQSFRIGNQNRASYEFRFKGKIDEPTVWGRALSGTEILALYNSGLASVSESTVFTTTYGSTNFSAVENISAVPQMTLATTAGSIKWNGVVNAADQDFDSQVRIGDGFVGINASSLHSSLDAPANVSINVGGCGFYDIYYATGFESNSLEDVKAAGQPCTPESSPACTNIVCENNVLTFTVEHFDLYGGEGGDVHAVPEFGTWALILALGLVAGGMFSMRKR